jgi:hypothetical protein
LRPSASTASAFGSLGCPTGAAPVL